MITQVCGPSVSGIPKDPRRKAQSVQFKHHSNISYSQNYTSSNNPYIEQEQKAMRTSTSIVIGSVLCVLGYFLLSGLKKSKDVL